MMTRSLFYRYKGMPLKNDLLLLSFGNKALQKTYPARSLFDWERKGALLANRNEIPPGSAEKVGPVNGLATIEIKKSRDPAYLRSSLRLVSRWRQE